jgi:hypothetical protein
MINYTWIVTQLLTETIEGNENYVVIAHCETIGVDGEYSASVPNVIQFSTEDVTVFVPYEDLTEEMVIAWIKESLGEEGVLLIEASIQAQIEAQKNPPVTPQETPLPWN